MVTTDRDALATGELRSRLQLRRLLRQPRWVLDDLGPTRGELRDPAEYLQGIRLWHRVRQDGYTMLGCRRARTLH
ncbi:MAG: hypothetical protein FWD04_08610, partial [Conexibacteraceae bacterium]|nr:hypothetical protein [Conexibacteraceae bacterium]